MPEVQKKVPEKKVPEKKVPVPKREAVPPAKGTFGKIFDFHVLLHESLSQLFLYFEFTSSFLLCLKKIDLLK